MDLPLFAHAFHVAVLGRGNGTWNQIRPLLPPLSSFPFSGGCRPPLATTRVYHAETRKLHALGITAAYSLLDSFAKELSIACKGLASRAGAHVVPRPPPAADSGPVKDFCCILQGCYTKVTHISARRWWWSLRLSQFIVPGDRSAGTLNCEHKPGPSAWSTPSWSVPHWTVVGRVVAIKYLVLLDYGGTGSSPLGPCALLRSPHCSLATNGVVLIHDTLEHGRMAVGMDAVKGLAHSLRLLLRHSAT